jgi:hypothetical protein
MTSGSSSRWGRRNWIANPRGGVIEIGPNLFADAAVV